MNGRRRARSLRGDRCTVRPCLDLPRFRDWVSSTLGTACRSRGGSEDFTARRRLPRTREGESSRCKHFGQRRAWGVRRRRRLIGSRIRSWQLSLKRRNPPHGGTSASSGAAHRNEAEDPASSRLFVHAGRSAPMAGWRRRGLQARRRRVGSLLRVRGDSLLATHYLIPPVSKSNSRDRDPISESTRVAARRPQGSPEISATS